MNTAKNNAGNPAFTLVTGASSGIGLELARVFAKNGHSLLLASRNIGKLELLAGELRTAYGCRVHTLKADLSEEGAAEKVFQTIRDMGIEVDILVNNAGAGSCGLFHEMAMESIVHMLKLDMEALTCLTRLFAEDMAEKKRGRILNVASTGSYQPGPYIAVYYAAKAYVLSFSYALAAELKSSGVAVSALCPGATRTGFAKAAGKADIPSAMDPAAVAKAAYRGLLRGKRVIIPGTGNKIAVFFSKFLPGSLNAEIVKKIQKKMIERFLTIL
jgi:hypothetical protein